VVAEADVGDHGDIAHVEAEAFAQHAATGGFEDGGVDVGVQQHVAGALRAGAVTGVDAPAFDVDAVGAGHADAQAVALENAADQAAGGGLAVGAGDGDDRNAGIVAIREHHADDGFADGAALAERGVEVHAQARCGVDFDDAATLVFERLAAWCRRRRRCRQCRGRWSARRPRLQAASSGCTSSVTSVAVPPVDRLALLRRTTRGPRRNGSAS
jgi:hypothetical protein